MDQAMSGREPAPFLRKHSVFYALSDASSPCRFSGDLQSIPALGDFSVVRRECFTFDSIGPINFHPFSPPGEILVLTGSLLFSSIAEGNDYAAH
jgi:hypothetical protein